MDSDITAIFCSARYVALDLQMYLLMLLLCMGEQCFSTRDTKSLSFFFFFKPLFSMFHNVIFRIYINVAKKAIMALVQSDNTRVAEMPSYFILFLQLGRQPLAILLFY